MTMVITLLPFLLAATGLAILCWPRKPLPDPGETTYEAFQQACAVYFRERDRRFRAAILFLLAAMVLLMPVIVMALHIMVQNAVCPE